MKYLLFLFLVLWSFPVWASVQFDSDDNGVIDAEYLLLIQSDCSGETETGIFCLDSDDGKLYYYDGDSVEEVGTGSGGDVVDDTTPQLGGDLDVNGHEIQSSGHVIFQLGDHDGTYSITVQDNNGYAVATINSDGEFEGGQLNNVVGQECDSTPDTDQHGCGDIITITISGSESNEVLMSPVYEDSTGYYQVTDADATGKKRCDCVLVENVTGDTWKCMTTGYFREDTIANTLCSGSCTAGDSFYASDDPTTNSGLTLTKPSNPDEVIRIGRFTDGDSFRIEPNRHSYVQE